MQPLKLISLATSNTRVDLLLLRVLEADVLDYYNELE
jgi:hypothetical protein